MCVKYRRGNKVDRSNPPLYALPLEIVQVDGLPSITPVTQVEIAPGGTGTVDGVLPPVSCPDASGGGFPSAGLTVLRAVLTSWWTSLAQRLHDARRGDRGDVPGWVMVTVMTAILVVVILGIFEPQIKKALGGIIDKVSNAG